MKAINMMSDREAMGLTAVFQASRADHLEEAYKVLKNSDINHLVDTLSSIEAPFEVRLAAGQLLALQGDPRIKTLEPVMCDIPAANATMGIDENKVDAIVKWYESVGVIRDWILKETPAHPANLSAFRIRKYLVTNKEYRDFLQETAYEGLPSSWEFGIYPANKANHPVYTIHERDAEAYAAWLSEKTDRQFCLPTEAQWEYAASGPAHNKFPWGDEEKPDHANTVEEQIFSSTPVGVFPKGDSPFGLSDMAGNVEEYTADDYAAYPNGSKINDDLLVSEKQYRVCRGGSFTRYADLARCARRHGRYNKSIYVIGFRLVEIINN
ncbi:MAG: hypothetical protein A3E87_06165 [Gammaproteobacteria bacterium RIFCSPHIGHO2_12_FULL_35_23]|nr:MAG: hypothetical protein A3E87_06165 [Gammaproteobacteria bacterium RIFCSPHIGHO2_12_FULL_35_23]